MLPTYQNFKLQSNTSLKKRYLMPLSIPWQKQNESQAQKPLMLLKTLKYNNKSSRFAN